MVTKSVAKDVVAKLEEIAKAIKHDETVLMQCQMTFHFDGRVEINLEYWDAEHL